VLMLDEIRVFVPDVVLIATSRIVSLRRDEVKRHAHECRALLDVRPPVPCKVA
jgi:hypothetical protein